MRVSGFWQEKTTEAKRISVVNSFAWMVFASGFFIPRWEAVRDTFHEIPDLIPHPPEVVELLFFAPGGSCQEGGVVEGDMNDPGLSWENRAILAGVITDGHHDVEWRLCKLVDMLRLLGGYVDAGFLHDPRCDGVQSVCFDPCRVRVYLS